MTVHDGIMRASRQATDDGANRTADIADAILASDVIAQVRAEEREKAAQIAEAHRSGNYDRPEDWTEYAHGVNYTSDGIAARIREQDA